MRGGGSGLILIKRMEEKINGSNNTVDENKEIALGICFGSGIGIVFGAIFNNVMLGLSAGGVLGVLVGIGVQTILKFKRVN